MTKIFALIFLTILSLNADFLEEVVINDLTIVKTFETSTIDLDDLAKPTLVIVKKNNCKWFKRWVKRASSDLKSEESAMRELMKTFNVILIDKAKDNYPTSMANKLSPSFFLIENGEIEGEINGFMSPEALKDTFIF